MRPQDIRQWFSKRERPPEQTRLAKTATELLNRVAALYGADARDSIATKLMNCDKILSQYAGQLSQLSGQTVQDVLYGALTKQDIREKLLAQAPSTILQKSAEASLERWAGTLCQFSASDLHKMAVDPKDWKRITRAHDDAGPGIANHEFHLKGSPAPEPYKEMLGHNIEFGSNKELHNGISAKMVHEMQEDSFGKHPDMTVMSKPYHKKIESATRGWCKSPILGWATMATRKLFEAGDIGHLCEKVSTHEHEGVPLTVHEFEPGFKNIGDAHDQVRHKEYTFPHEDVMKIATMDFLANNVDRHTGNLMVPLETGDTDKRGYNSLLAIDHERNFQYNRPIKRHHSADPKRWEGDPDQPGMVRAVFEGSQDAENPMDYIKHQSALRLAHSNASFAGLEEYADWWKQKGPAIKQEFDKQLMGIHDKRLREHLKKNFDARSLWLDNFVAKAAVEDLYDEHAWDKHPGVEMQKRSRPENIKKVLAGLPKDSREAFDSVSDWLKDKRAVSQDQFDTVKDALSEKLQGASRDELWDTYLHGLTSPRYRDHRHQDQQTSFSPSILTMRHVVQSRDPGLIRSFVNKLEKLDPKHRVSSNSDWWLAKLRDKLKAGDKA